MVESAQDKTARPGALLGFLWGRRPRIRGLPIEVHPRARLRLSRTGRRRTASVCLGALGGVLFVLVAAAALIAMRLSQGPISIAALAPRIAAALDGRFGRGYQFAIGDTILASGEHGPSLAIDGLVLKDAGGRTVVNAPKAEVSLDRLALLAGTVTPRRLEILDVELRLIVRPDGTVAVSAGTDPGQSITLADAFGSPGDPGSSQPSVIVPESKGAALHAVTVLLRSLLDAVTSPDSAFAAIDRLGISRGRLVLDDRTTGKSVIFKGLELSFDKADDGSGAILTVSANGPSGRWSLTAHATGRPDTQRLLEVDIRDLSLDEIVLIAGNKNPGFAFDMPISAKLTLALNVDGTY